MTAVACTLVSLCVSLTLVSGLPTAKRLALPHDTDDVLAGSDFLSVFMQRRTADRPAHHYDHDLNSVSHRYHYSLNDIFKTAKYGYHDAEKYQPTVPPVEPTLEDDTRTTTLFTEPTTIEDVPTTITYDFNETVNFTIEEVQTPSPANYEFSTHTELTTEPVTEKVEEKVISVRVSSSVERHSHRVIETSTAKSVSRVRGRQEDENLVSTLVTQEQPTITAVQRSEFGVEEAALPDSKTPDEEDPPPEKQEEIEGKVQEVSLYNNDQQRAPQGKLPVFEIHFHNPPAALISTYNNPEVHRSEDVPSYRRKEFRQLSQPISYQSRVSSPTSDSSVKFYRDHPVQSAAETVHQPVLADPYPPASYQQGQINQDGNNPGDPNYKKVYHEEPRERSYGEPEKVYGEPEENYEVDEAVSVITNGKAHGVQVPTPPPVPTDPSQNKFGYVVEGRNFRKYRVEERTADGFIVGEYGVVSHDDGSLRGVRYTADSNINPRLIYDTLVKFLSLK